MLQFASRVLLDDHLEDLARRLGKDDLYRLAPKLDIPEEEVHKIFAKHCLVSETKSIESAVHDVLKWMKKQRNRKDAYVIMTRALTDSEVELNLLAAEILDYHPSKKSNDISCTAQRFQRFLECEETRVLSHKPQKQCTC